MTSAYPLPVDELVPQALALAEELGETPSQNRVRAALRVGKPKARAVLAELSKRAATADPAAPADPADSQAEPTADPGPATETDAASAGTEPESSTQVAADADPGPTPAPARPRRVSAWPVLLLAFPASVAIWSGWVGLGSLTGFGLVHPLPGIADGFTLNSAITLPVGMEAYAAYALWVWLAGVGRTQRTRRYARWSALGSLGLGMAGQVAYHLMVSAGITRAPWQITTLVACLPVAVLALGAALLHLQRGEQPPTWKDDHR